jgi:hypothetical protein
VNRYLTYEIRCYRWIQISDAEREEKGLKKEHGLKFKNKKDGSTWYEYHVDDHPDWLNIPEEEFPYGGNLSIRMEDEDMKDVKPLIILGQDEAIFRQYLLTVMCWQGSDGSIPLVPKDDGISIMMSAITCREFGFGMPLSDAQLRKLMNTEKKMQIRTIGVLNLH